MQNSLSSGVAARKRRWKPGSLEPGAGTAELTPFVSQEDRPRGEGRDAGGPMCHCSPLHCFLCACVGVGHSSRELPGLGKGQQRVAGATWRCNPSPQAPTLACLWPGKSLMVVPLGGPAARAHWPGKGSRNRRNCI